MDTLTLQPAVAASLHAWHDMIARRDLSGLDAITRPDVRFRSPAVHKPYQSAPVLALILGTVIQVFEDFTYHRQFASEDGLNVVLEFSARVGDRVALESCTAARSARRRARAHPRGGRSAGSGSEVPWCGHRVRSAGRCPRRTDRDPRVGRPRSRDRRLQGLRAPRLQGQYSVQEGFAALLAGQPFQVQSRDQDGEPGDDGEEVFQKRMHGLSAFVVFDLLEQIFKVIDLYFLDFQKFSILMD